MCCVCVCFFFLLGKGNIYLQYQGEKKIIMISFVFYVFPFFFCRSYGTMPNPIKCNAGIYRNQPGRIENYVPGRSSVADKERKEVSMIYVH